MILRRTNFVPGEIKTIPTRCATIVGSRSTSLMIAPNQSSPTKSKKMRAINTSTQGRAMRRKTQARRGLSREKRISRPSLENGSPMAKPQVMIQMMMNPRRQLWESPCMMMMSHLYLHHQCASWQEVTTR